MMNQMKLGKSWLSHLSGWKQLMHFREVEAVDIVDVTHTVELMKMQRLGVIFIGWSC
jgi:hypothetical protein